MTQEILPQNSESGYDWSPCKCGAPECAEADARNARRVQAVRSDPSFADRIARAKDRGRAPLESFARAAGWGDDAAGLSIEALAEISVVLTSSHPAASFDPGALTSDATSIAAAHWQQ